MKKVSFVLAALLFAALPLKAQQVMEDSFQQLKVHYSTPSMKIDVVAAGENAFYRLTADGYIAGGEIGTPELPQQSSMIIVPICKGFDIVVENAVYDTVTIPSGLDIMPVQPSRSKSDNTHHDIVIDQQIYSTNSFVGQHLAQVENIGIARDRNLARLIFSPVQVNPQTNTAVICRSADITVRYNNPNEEATTDLFQRYNSPMFSIGATLNTLLSPKDVSMTSPIRMAVVTTSSLRCSKLNTFLNWKRRQGMRVDVYYTDELGLQSNTAIANMISGLYTNASATDPAPSFLLIIGDVAQVPSHNSRITSSGWSGPDNDHITDLYYTTWTTGDKIPDCYHGRFSATDTNTLGNIIDKTLLYEQYNFADDSYLARAALVAGEDNGYHTESGWLSDNAWKYADPALDYVAYYYVNADNGFTDVTYYKNDTSYAPDGVTITGYCSDNAAPTQLLNLYNTGIGFINYSAHGDWDCWHKPNFDVQDVNSMTNNNMPSFMIGSCCLTNKFEKPACFGEALLRKNNNAGAIGYIGGSNSTYWSEDFYWAVGIRNNITHLLAPNYDSVNRGAYDFLFHTHGEDITSSAATASRFMFCGNMAVQNSSSTLKDYYWEIYHLMGDPSLMPWLGRAKDPFVSYIPTTSNSTVTIHTEPNAYVAFVEIGTLEVKSAGFADANGVAEVPHPAYINNCMLSVTAQGFKPFCMNFTDVAIDGVIDSDSWNVYPNPATAEATVTGLPADATLQIFDQTGRLVISTTGRAINTVLLAPGVYIVRASTASGTATKKLVVR